MSCEAFKPEKDLVDGLCPVHGTKPEWIREKNHFFRLSNYRKALLDHFEAHPEFLQPDVRRNEILRLLEGGLEDISISRAGQLWGIPLPFDPASVVYVWFDALINYASAVGYGDDEARFAEWWPADLHVIGKDITRFHCVIWPAMLMSAGLAAAAPGVRPRVRAVQGPEDEQVARDGRSTRSTSRGSSAPTRCGSTWSRRSRTARTATSRGSASRSATTSTWRTTSATW